jgi:hypothetical protein
MAIAKPILNMAVYVSTIILILLLGLVVLKSRGSVVKNSGNIDSAVQTAQENKEALANMDTKIENKIRMSTRAMETKINTIRTLNLRMKQEINELQKKVDESSSASSASKSFINPLTRSRYSLIPYPLPWHMAKKYAEENGGRLVVIDSQVENEWLVKTFGSNTEYWIGLTDEATEGQWLWVDGKKAEYFNWGGSEPDNYRKNQHYGIINAKAPHLNQTVAGKWNDVVANEIRIGIIEYKAQTIPTRAPRTRSMGLN